MHTAQPSPLHITLLLNLPLPFTSWVTFRIFLSLPSSIWRMRKLSTLLMHTKANERTYTRQGLRAQRRGLAPLRG